MSAILFHSSFWNVFYLIIYINIIQKSVATVIEEVNNLTRAWVFTLKELPPLNLRGVMLWQSSNRLGERPHTRVTSLLITKYFGNRFCLNITRLFRHDSLTCCSECASRLLMLSYREKSQTKIRKRKVWTTQFSLSYPVAAKKTVVKSLNQNQDIFYIVVYWSTFVVENTDWLIKHV